VEDAQQAVAADVRSRSDDSPTAGRHVERGLHPAGQRRLRRGQVDHRQGLRPRRQADDRPQERAGSQSGLGDQARRPAGLALRGPPDPQCANGRRLPRLRREGAQAGSSDRARRLHQYPGPAVLRPNAREGQADVQVDPRVDGDQRYRLRLLQGRRARHCRELHREQGLLRRLLRSGPVGRGDRRRHGHERDLRDPSLARRLLGQGEEPSHPQARDQTRGSRRDRAALSSTAARSSIPGSRMRATTPPGRVPTASTSTTRRTSRSEAARSPTRSARSSTPARVQASI